MEDVDTTHPGHKFVKLHQDPPEEEEEQQESAEEEAPANDDVPTEAVSAQLPSLTTTIQPGLKNGENDGVTTSTTANLGAFAYSPLSPPANDNFTIRLFTLQPGQKEDGLQGTLLATEIGKAPPFEALSYFWGDETIKTPIIVSGYRLEVTENLKLALIHLRDSKTPRTIWIDAICINQQDDNEKALQVAEMTAIYSKAQQTIVWLGEERDSSGEVIQECWRSLHETDTSFWRSIFGDGFEAVEATESDMKDALASLLERTENSNSTTDLFDLAADSVSSNDVDPEQGNLLRDEILRMKTLARSLSAFSLLEFLRKAKANQSSGDPSTNGASSTNDTTSFIDAQEAFPLKASTRASTSPSKKPTALDFQALFRREWFRRIWIIQEVACASRVTVHCGDEQIDWWLLFWSVIPIALQNSQHRVLLLEAGLSTFMEIGRARQSLSQVLNTGSDDDDAFDILALLQNFRRFNATNPRDKVNNSNLDAFA